MSPTKTRSTAPASVTLGLDADIAAYYNAARDVPQKQLALLMQIARRTLATASPSPAPATPTAAQPATTATQGA